MRLELDELVLRDATEADLPGLLDLYRHLALVERPVRQEVQQQTYRKMLQTPGLSVLLACWNQQLLASCVLVVIPNLTRGCASYALIENVVTHSGWRGNGIGERLMRTAIERAFEAGCYKVMLLSGAENTRAHAFYKRIGFSTTKTGFEVRAQGYPPKSFG